MDCGAPEFRSAFAVTAPVPCESQGADEVTLRLFAPAYPKHSGAIHPGYAFTSSRRDRITADTSTLWMGISPYRSCLGLALGAKHCDLNVASEIYYIKTPSATKILAHLYFTSVR
jgi:hypothetical protein